MLESEWRLGCQENVKLWKHRKGDKHPGTKPELISKGEWNSNMAERQITHRSTRCYPGHFRVVGRKLKRERFLGHNSRMSSYPFPVLRKFIIIIIIIINYYYYYYYYYYLIVISPIQFFFCCTAWWHNYTYKYTFYLLPLSCSIIGD